MKTKTQDPKFYIENNRLVGQSGPVPEDEPLFILRARDVNAAPILKRYLALACDNGAQSEHLQAVVHRILQFEQFRSNHPERMKIPDTDFAAMVGASTPK